VPESASRATQPWAYFDTSIIAKQYLAEAGSGQARALFRRHQVVSSLLAPLELASGFRRRLAGGEITGPEYETALRDMADDRTRWELVSLQDDVLRRAERLIRRIAVRTLDAIHVASAMFVADGTGISLPFVTADARQRDAAEAAGLRVIWIA